MKNKNDKNLAEVFHFNLYGKREEKYNFLNQNSISTLEWNKLQANEPNFFFVPKNFDEIKSYEIGFKLDELFIQFGGSIKTERDKISINLDKNCLKEVVNDFKNLNKEQLRLKYNLQEDSRDWGVERAKNDITQNYNFNKFIKSIEYRPFDKRFIYYTGNSKGFVGTPGFKINKHLLNENIALNSTRYNRQLSLGYIFISNSLTDIHLLDSAADSLGIFPLYLYPETTAQQTIGQSNERTPNLNTEIVKQIAEKLGLKFTNEKETTENTFAPIDILDYIYAVLHSPTYREKYKEFLKIDFPRVPYPQTLSKFRTLTKLGAELRQIHLLESPTVEEYITQYPIDGDNVVNKINFAKVSNFGKVFINDTQYFDKVPEIAWNFYIGGYQPAQKWLKDRKNRKLEFEDILHYQKIIVALSETDRIMKEIDNIEI